MRDERSPAGRRRRRRRPVREPDRDRRPRRPRRRPLGCAGARPREREQRVRLGVELTDAQITFLRGLSRPSRTGGQRTLGAKFVAAGVLSAAIELLEQGAIDMHGVTAGDQAEMTARARAALLRAGATQHPTSEKR